MSQFECAILEEQLLCQQWRKPIRNISVRQWELIQFLRRNDLYIVVEGDKNLGPCILDRAIYVERGCSEHLGNSTNYRELNDTWVQLFKKKLDYRFEAWLTKYHTRLKQISKAEATFLRRAREQNPDQLARFRMTAKVHKTPWKTRPIVCCAGTWMNAWSKWLDYWLQKLKPFVKTFVKDSQQIIDEISTLELPQYALLVTCDANSMYNNIDTAHAIEVILKWLRALHATNQLPDGFPLDAVISAMITIMTNNIFEWGDLYFLQLLGTAMGTSAAVMWATLYFAYHEEHTLIPMHSHNLL